MRRAIATQRAFSLAEMLIGMIGTSIIVGALLVTAMELQKSLHNSETYGSCQTDEHRLLDYVTRDLRRAIGIATTETIGGSGGSRLLGASVTVENNTSLLVTLPGYYQSNKAADHTYDQALPVVAVDNYVDYGTTSGHAAGVPVLFRKEFLTSENCACFVRHEGDSATIIVRHAENLHLQIDTASDGCSCTVEVSFTPPLGRAATLVTSRDTILLRNIRID